jgi:hypothetical protein
MLTELPSEQHDIGDFYILKLIVEGRDVHSTDMTADCNYAVETTLHTSV